LKDTHTLASAPKLKQYDVVIVGGGMFGASVAWFLVDYDDFIEDHSLWENKV